MALMPFEKDPNDHDINTEAQAEAEAAATAATGGGGRGGRGGAGTAAVPTNVQVKIVWDGIERRITEVTNMAGVQSVTPSPDGRTYLFSAAAGGGGATPAADAAAAGPGMYTIADDGTHLTHLNTTVTDNAAAGRGRGGRGGGGFGGGGEATWARDGRSIYFMQGGGLFNLAIAGSAAAGDTAPAAAAAGGGVRGGRAGGGAAQRQVVAYD